MPSVDVKSAKGWLSIGLTILALACLLLFLGVLYVRYLCDADTDGSGKVSKEEFEAKVDSMNIPDFIKSLLKFVGDLVAKVIPYE